MPTVPYFYVDGTLSQSPWENWKTMKDLFRPSSTAVIPAALLKQLPNLESVESVWNWKQKRSWDDSDADSWDVFQGVLLVETKGASRTPNLDKLPNGPAKDFYKSFY